MVGLKEICQKFDSTFEFEGGKRLATINKLAEWIVETINDPEKQLSEITKNWLIWMYGKVANELKEPNEEILGQYAKIGETYDKLSKKIAEEFHPTSMFQVVQIKEDTIRKMLKEINGE